MKDFSQLADDETLQQTKVSLEKNGFHVLITENGTDAKEAVLNLIPKGAEVMTATSRTLDTLGLTQEINESGNYDSVKSKLNKLDREKDHLEMQKLGAASEYVLGSVHAVTEDGKVMVASNTGSQLPTYAYGSSHVVWVVSTKKIVKNLDEGFSRIYDYILPQEDKRLKGQYGPQVHSEVRKLLIVNSEIKPGRITVIFVKEQLGF